MSELLKSFWGKLYAWALPSGLVLGAAWLFVLPQLGDGIGSYDLLAEDKRAPTFFALTAVLAISLSSVSAQLYRILEGYYWPRWLQEWGIRRQREKKDKLRDSVNGTGWRRGIAMENLARFPYDDRQLVPTRFGNAIRAFETYGKTRFNMDSQTLWCELVAVTPKYIQSELESARSSVDFFVTLLYLSGIFAVTCLVIGVIEHFKIGILLLSIPALLLAVLSHWLAIRAIDAWSYPVHALVNLGRAKLADSLGLRLPETIVQEKAMWGLVVRYAYYADQKYGEKLDMYRKPTEPRSESVSREKAESEPDENGGDDAETKT